MKNITLLIALIVGIPWAALSQGCLPDGIEFFSQSEIDNFQANHPNCTEIEGGVYVSGSDITNLNGLNMITSIGVDLAIEYNYSLTDITGLSSLTSVGASILLVDNISLPSLSGLDGITIVNQDLSIYNHRSLISLAGLNSITSVGSYLDLYGNSLLTDLTGLNGLTTVNLQLYIAESDSLVSLNGLEGLTSVGNDLVIWNNESLQSLTELEQLSSIKSLSLFNNPVLVNLSGLESLVEIRGRLRVVENNELTDFTGINNVTSIGGSLEIRDNPQLANLMALASVVSINGMIGVENNDALSTLAGLDHINPATIDSIEIFGNQSLSTCEVQSVCEYLATPGTIVNIHDNASGCNSEQQVDSACQVVNITELQFSNLYSLFPIPAHDKLHILTHNDEVVEQVSIYNQFGQKVKSGKAANNVIDIKGLKSGLYIIEIQHGKTNFRKNFIVG